jgi:hypothetical protein
LEKSLCLLLGIYVRVAVWLSKQKVVDLEARMALDLPKGALQDSPRSDVDFEGTPSDESRLLRIS